jgi:hypothetical protein
MHIDRADLCDLPDHEDAVCASDRAARGESAAADHPVALFGERHSVGVEK